MIWPPLLSFIPWRYPQALKILDNQLLYKTYSTFLGSVVLAWPSFPSLSFSWICRAPRHSCCLGYMCISKKMKQRMMSEALIARSVKVGLWMGGCPWELMLFENNVTEFFRKIGCLLTTSLTYAKELILQSSSYL